jgi:hypothetical protein
MWGRTPQGLAKLRAAVINAKKPLHFTAVWVVGLSQWWIEALRVALTAQALR